MLRTIFKTVPVAMLALVAGLAGGPDLLVLALALSALGDLALSRAGDRAFLVGLGSFALAHLAYIVLFASLATGWPALFPVLALVAYAISTEVWLIPYTAALRGPVRLYVVLITGMGIAALALPGMVSMALIGAGAFVASDTILAVQLFRLSPQSRWYAPAEWSLWALYYGAQLLILWAVIG
ncbi:lysoplasmalogenase family protein [Roseovarius sp. CAU 1744]|uniref:lysoplasmalogenase family protein n=1 Tax=Roseovarius sp. CAU 1744 TaxID=3140368 RepID=UPI00325C1E14